MNNGAKLIRRRLSLSWTNQGLEGLLPASQCPCLTWGLLSQCAEKEQGGAWLAQTIGTPSQRLACAGEKVCTLPLVLFNQPQRGGTPASYQICWELSLGVSLILEASLNKIT